MKLAPFPSVRFVRLLALLVFPALGAHLLAQTSVPPSTQVATDPYRVAVNQYVDAATKEVDAIRTEIVSNEKLGKTELYAPARTALEACENLVTRLKSAGQGDFDRIKSEYERNRADLLQKLNTARQGTS